MIDIRNLTIDFNQKGQTVRALSGLTLQIPRNQIFALIGESGSGKTITALSLMGLLKKKVRNVRIAGQIIYQNLDLLSENESTLRQIRGNKLSMVFQNPFTFFDPSYRIKKQFQELSGYDFKLLSLALKAVKLSEPERILKSYPYQLSGGQLQRLMIASALFHQPELLIADEPTTALDPSLKWGVLNMLKTLKEEKNLTLFIISHDLRSILTVSNQVGILYRGFLLEVSSTPELTQEMIHPYTKQLISMDGFSNPPLSDIPNTGCPYAQACPRVKSICLKEMPPWFQVSKHHRIRCWLFGEHNESLAKN